MGQSSGAQLVVPICQLEDGECVAVVWNGEDANCDADCIDLFPSDVERRALPVFVPITRRSANRAAAVSRVSVVTPGLLDGDPTPVLGLIDRARAEGDLIALSGVGSHPRALGLLPLIEPDVIVVGAGGLSNGADSDPIALAQALAAVVERSNAVVVADGIDTDRDCEHALALGIRHGSGRKFESLHRTPDPMRRTRPRPLLAGPTWQVDPVPVGSTPFSLISPGRERIRSVKGLLVEMSTQLEEQARSAGSEVVAVGTFQRLHHFPASTERRWSNLARTISFTAAYGEQFSPASDLGIHRYRLHPHDPLIDEWNVIVIGARFACALSALDLHTGGPDDKREFDYVVTYDRSTIVRAARSVLCRPVASAATAAAGAVRSRAALGDSRQSDSAR
ncbi:EAL domain-containing protein [Rhodococcus hoagii]|nr:EAL domain-containing protein [Prescottella equi]